MKLINPFNFYIALTIIILLFPNYSFSKGKIYGHSKTLSKEYKKYENCLLKKTEANIKDDEKDGYKCIYKRQTRGKDVTIFQPTNACIKAFKCKQEPK